MPFKSKAQMRYMFATHPKIAKEFAKETPNAKLLPNKAKKKPNKNKLHTKYYVK
jgi:hypothetical protein